MSRGATRLWCRTVHSRAIMVHTRAIHDVVVGVLRGDRIDPHQARLAFRAPLPIWRRVLGFEGCGAQLDHRLRTRGLSRELPDPLRRLLRDATASALRLGMLAHQQLAEVAALAQRSGVRVLALKGGAQLLDGHPAATRSIADIDLLVAPADGVRFHELLANELRYSTTGPAYPHHLPVLERAGSLNIDLHVRLSDVAIPLDTAIWAGTRQAAVGGHTIELPSATNMVLHVLEHGVGLNWMGRYRLRDVLDIATLYSADVSDNEIRSYAAQSRGRAACETLLSAAHHLEPRVPRSRATAWRTIRRVSRTRLALAVLPRDPRVAERVFRYAGVVAEGSPRTILRAGRVLARHLAAAAISVAMPRTRGRSEVAHDDREPSSAAGGIVLSSPPIERRGIITRAARARSAAPSTMPYSHSSPSVP